MNEYGPLTEIETTAVRGVTALDGADSGLSPTEFVACTVKVYATPLVRPETSALVAEAETAVVLKTTPFASAVTVLPERGKPPVLAGAVHVTEACPSPATACTFVGAVGTETSCVELLDDESALDPCAFEASTLN